MSERPDRLFDLLPVVLRRHDAEQDWPLRALLRVIGEQADVVEADLDQSYENWFIETCEDWVVPYIGDLIGYKPVHARLPLRREVANTIAYRRRKGTLPLLELLARDVAGWPARAVEYYALLGWTQAINHLHLDRGRTVDVRAMESLDRLGGPFEALAHTVDVRRIGSTQTRGRHNIPSVGLFVWRLKPYSVTHTVARQLEEVGAHAYAFNVLGHETQLFARPEPEPDPSSIAGELNLPVPIDRRLADRRLRELYGSGASFVIYRRTAGGWAAVPLKDIVIADLTGWRYRPVGGRVAVDPVRGLIAFSDRAAEDDVLVSYHYGFAADIGGGEYARRLSQPAGARIYRVGPDAHPTISDALKAWRRDAPVHGVVEIVRSGEHTERLDIRVGEDKTQTLQIRAANGARPVLRLLDYAAGRSDLLRIRGANHSRVVLDGLLIAENGVQVEGDLHEIALRHCTLVPGWRLGRRCEPAMGSEPSLILARTPARLIVERSIVGSIQVLQDRLRRDPNVVLVSDSTIDATDAELAALDDPGCPLAHVDLTISRSTVIGRIDVHAVELAENCIFAGALRVGRRRRGCVRFSSISPGSRTPRRYSCQPDLAEQVVDEAARPRERLRVRPRFASLRYGTPTYCRLAPECAAEIAGGADDESEMGVYHHLFEPQRLESLRTRLNEYTPVGIEAGILLAT